MAKKRLYAKWIAMDEVFGAAIRRKLEVVARRNNEPLDTTHLIQYARK